MQLFRIITKSKKMTCPFKYLLTVDRNCGKVRVTIHNGLNWCIYERDTFYHFGIMNSLDKETIMEKTLELLSGKIPFYYVEKN